MKGTEFISAPDVYTADTLTPIPTLAETDVIVLSGIDRSANLVDPGSGTQATLYINYIEGALTNATIKVYGSYSDDPTAGEWFQETDAIGDAGTITLHDLEITMAANTQCTWHFPIGALRSLRVTIQGTGESNVGSALDLTLAVRTN